MIHDDDGNRFSDRSRELWSERIATESHYKQNNFLKCCGRCPFASFLAFLFTLTGTGIFCGCIYHALKITIEAVNNAFKIQYVEVDWIRMTRLGVIFVSAVMCGLCLILLIVGCLATGATRHQVYTGFRSRLSGRIATGFFSIVVYLLFIIWVITTLALVVPCIGYFILNYRCTKEVRTVETDPLSPTRCLWLGHYGLNIPKQRNDHTVCQESFVELCNRTTEAGPRYIAALCGSLLVVLGLLHFLCCLVANYAHIKDGIKLRDYEDAIKEELELSKLNR